MKNKKILIIFGLSIILTLIGIFNITYAFFREEKKLTLSFESANTFGTSVVKNISDSFIANESNRLLPGNSKATGAKITPSLLVTNESASYITTLVGQVDPNYTTFTDGTPIIYEVFHKTDSGLDTSSLTCTDNIYTLDDSSTGTCVTGNLSNKLDGAPFEMLSNLNIDANVEQYFDIYLWINGSESGDEVADKKIKVSFFFVTTANVETTE